MWDAIDQQYLVPFSYFGVHDGTDLTEVPWRRGTGYDPTALTNVLTADHAWARRVIEQVRLKTADPQAIKALGFCVSIVHARFMAEQFTGRRDPSRGRLGRQPDGGTIRSLRDLEAGRVKVVFTVDLFNEGVDVPERRHALAAAPDREPDALPAAARPRTATSTREVALHRARLRRQSPAEFRLDRRYRALLGGSRRDVERQIENDFPFLPSGCHMELDPVARDIVLRSIRQAIPSDWRAKCDELRSLGDVDLATYLQETGLELEDVYANNRSWSALRRAVNLPTEPAGPNEDAILRAVGRLLHVDDLERIDAYRSLVDRRAEPPDLRRSAIANGASRGC